MKVRSVAVVVALVVASLCVRANADSDPLSYDDPGMHFKAPDGWHRAPSPEDSSSPGLDDKKTLAVYTEVLSKTDARVISIVADPFDSGLDAAESSHEGDVRSDTKSTLVEKKTKTTLANGMPAWFLKINQGSDNPFTALTVYEYVVYDGSRRVVASYTGREFGITEDDAKKALASLYVVVYPRHRA